MSSDDSDDMFNTPPTKKEETRPSSSGTPKRKLLNVKHLLRNGGVRSSDSDSSYDRETRQNASSPIVEKSRRVDLKTSIPKKNVTSDSDDAIDSDKGSTAPRLSPAKIGLSVANKLKTIVPHSSESDDSGDDVFKRPTVAPFVQLSAVSEADSDDEPGKPTSKPVVPPARLTSVSGEHQRPNTLRLSESGGRKPTTRLDPSTKTNISESSSDSDDDFIASSPRRGVKKAAGALSSAVLSPAVRRLSSARHDTRTVPADRPAKDSTVVDTSWRKAPFGYESKEMPTKTSNKQSSGSDSESSADNVKQRSKSKDVPAKTSNKSSGSDSESSADNVKQRSKSKDVPAKTSNKQSSGSDSESSADNVKQRSKSKDVPAKTSNKSSGSDSESSADNVKQRSKSNDVPTKTSNKQSSATSSKYPESTNATKTASNSSRGATTARHVPVSSDSDSESDVDHSTGRAKPSVASPHSCSSGSDDDSRRRVKPSSLKAASTDLVRTNETSRPRPSRHDVSSSGSESSSTEGRGRGDERPALVGSGLVADNTPGVLCAEELTPDEEVWLVQCPVSLTGEALLTFSFDLCGKSAVSVESAEGVLTRYQATPHPRSEIALNTACLLRGRAADTLTAVVVHSAGQIVITRQFSPPAAVPPSSPPAGPIPLPGGLKVRHPLFGADYKDSILERDKSADPPQVRVRYSKKPERRSVTFASPPGEEDLLPGSGGIRQEKKKKRETLGASWQDEEQRGDVDGLPEDILSEEERRAEKRERRKRKRAALVATEGGEGMRKTMEVEEDTPVLVDNRELTEEALAKEKRKKARKERREQKTIVIEEQILVDNRELTDEALAKERRKMARKERREQKTMEIEEQILVDNRELIQEALAKERRKKARKQRREQKAMEVEEQILVDNRELTEEALAKEIRKKARKERRKEKAMENEEDTPVMVDDRAEETVAKDRRKQERRERKAMQDGRVEEEDEESLRSDLLSAMLRKMGGGEKKRRRDSTASTDGKPAKRRKMAAPRALDVHFRDKQEHDAATKQAHDAATKQARDAATKQARDAATKQAHDTATKQAHDLNTVHSAEEVPRKSKKKKKKDSIKGDEGGEGTDVEGATTGAGCSLEDEKGDSETTPKKKKKKKGGKEEEGGLDVTVTDFAAFSGGGVVVCSTQKRETGGFKAPFPPQDDGGRESGFESDCTAQLFVTQRPRKEVDGFESDATAKLFRTQRDPLDYDTPRKKKKKHSM